MKKKIFCLMAVTLLSVAAFAQNAPTNAPQFQVALNFLGSGAYDQSSALSTAFTTQFTTNVAFRGDVIAMPGAGYSGYLGGAQYNLCGNSAIEKLLSTTSISCGKITPYLTGSLGLGRLQQNMAPNTTANQSIAGLFRVGANYDPTGTGKFSFNLFEGGWGHFGPSVPGQTSNAWFYQSGIAVGLGSNASATQAKIYHIAHANARKLKKLNEKIAREQKS